MIQLSNSDISEQSRGRSDSRVKQHHLASRHGDARPSVTARSDVVVAGTRCSKVTGDEPHPTLSHLYVILHPGTGTFREVYVNNRQENIL